MRIQGAILFVFAICHCAVAQTYPSFGPEIKVTINGLTFDAMEPFISSDETTLFFNSINSGGNTNLYYATRINDSTFNYIGLVNGTYDPSPSHLDAVASLDSLNKFFWVSLRGYPSSFDNLHQGVYTAGNVNSIHRIHGSIYVYSPGWLIMDAAIDHSGNNLYYCNAYFNSCSFGMPCEAKLGIGQKVNDSTYSKLSNSDALLSAINDTNYIVYAPQVSIDGLELYFTRILKTTVNSEICVSVRNTTSDTFSIPQVIHSNLGFVPEAATISSNKQKIYYHQKDGSGLFKIYMRYRSESTGIEEKYANESILLYPNPATDLLKIRSPKGSMISVYSIDGKKLENIKSYSEETTIDISNYNKGFYFLYVKTDQGVYTNKFIKG